MGTINDIPIKMTLDTAATTCVMAEKVAKANRLAFVFDKAAELVIVYTDPRHDYTDFILEELGLGDPNDKVK